MTAAQAILRECRSCIGSARSKCTTTVCKLHPDVFKYRSSVKRIKVHCLDCAAQDLGETRHEAVRSCTGRLGRENGNAAICWLHQYRLGRNSDRPKRTPPPSQFPPRTPRQTRFPGPGSPISSMAMPEGG